MGSASPYEDWVRGAQAVAALRRDDGLDILVRAIHGKRRVSTVTMRRAIEEVKARQKLLLQHITFALNNAPPFQRPAA